MFICHPSVFAGLFGIVYNTSMSCDVVIDTNVFVSALRSKNGASYKLITMVGKGRFDVNVSVPLVLEYEASPLCQYS